MSKSTKAVLLSALLFPGSGHIYLKKYYPGIILLSCSLAGIFYIVSKTVENAIQITEKIQNSNIQLSVTDLTKLISEQTDGSDTQLMNIATATIIICWLVGIIDSYRLGRLND